MITLKQAFAQWSNAPRNTVLAANSRTAVQRVLMKEWGDIALESITASLAERMFGQSRESKEMKVKAAAILVYLLQWGGDHGYCQRPSFTYEIANAVPKKDAVPEERGQGVPDGAGENAGGGRDAEEPAREPAKEGGKPDGPMHGGQKKPIAQLHPETLEVVRQWPSCHKVATELGICNINRAAKNKRMAGGFFWCTPEEAKTFKPSQPYFHAQKHLRDTAGVRPAPVPCDVTQAKAGGHPASLAAFADDELWRELERRGWEGEISRRHVVKIGQ